MSNGIPQRILDAFKTNSTGIPAYVTPAYLAQTEDPTTAGGIVFLIIATLIVSIFRGYSRVSIIKNIGIDDWLALFSLVGELACLRPFQVSGLIEAFVSHRC